jgi:hypothetical protein
VVAYRVEIVGLLNRAVSPYEIVIGDPRPSFSIDMICCNARRRPVIRTYCVVDDKRRDITQRTNIINLRRVLRQLVYNVMNASGCTRITKPAHVIPVWHDGIVYSPVAVAQSLRRLAGVLRAVHIAPEFRFYRHVASCEYLSL